MDLDLDLLGCYKKYLQAKEEFLESGGDVFDAMKPAFYASSCHFGLDFMEACYDKISFLGGRYDEDPLHPFGLPFSKLTTTDDLKDMIGHLWLILIARELHFRYYFSSERVVPEMLKLFSYAKRLSVELERRFMMLAKEVSEGPCPSEVDLDPFAEMRSIMTYCDLFLLSFSHTHGQDCELEFDSENDRQEYFLEYYCQFNLTLDKDGFWSGKPKYARLLSDRAFGEVQGGRVPYDQFSLSSLLSPEVHGLSKFILKESIKDVSIGLYERFSGACGEGGEDA